MKRRMMWARRTSPREVFPCALVVVASLVSWLILASVFVFDARAAVVTNQAGLANGSMRGQDILRILLRVSAAAEAVHGWPADITVDGYVMRSGRFGGPRVPEN